MSFTPAVAENLRQDIKQEITQVLTSWGML
jgi:hypothetical protein